MTAYPSRRCFVHMVAATGGGLCLGMPGVAAGGCESEIEKAKQEYSQSFQKRQLRDQMTLFKKLVAKYGDGVVAEVEAHTVAEAARRFAEMELDVRDLSAVKSLLWSNLGDGFEFECVTDEPQLLSYRVTRCYLADEVAAHGTAELGFAFYCAWDVGFCRGLNPKIRFTRSTTLMAGESCCNHTYEL